MNIIDPSQEQDTPKTGLRFQVGYWDVAFLIKAGEFSPAKQKTFLKKVRGGWLLRHLYFRGRQFTRSAIIFFPDADGVWEDCQFGIHWERFNTRTNSEFNLILERLKVPEGWIVKEFLITKPHYSGEGVTGINLTYIPDPDHEWEI